MMEYFKNILGLLFFATVMNVLGYQYLFSDLEIPVTEQVIILELPEPVPLRIVEQVEVEHAELKCMAKNIFHEARNQNLKGQYAVGFVTLNRVDHVLYPNSICEVVFEPSQFSWTHQDVSIDKTNIIEQRAWEQSLQIALDVMQGEAYNNLYGVTHYHADYVNPDWGYQVAATIDNHIFYRSF